MTLLSRLLTEGWVAGNGNGGLSRCRGFSSAPLDELLLQTIPGDLIELRGEGADPVDAETTARATEV